MLFDEELPEHVIGPGPRRYVRALDYQLELLHRLEEEGRQGDVLRQWWALWFDSMVGALRETAPGFLEDQRRLYKPQLVHEGTGAPVDGGSDGVGFMLATRLALDLGETYYVEDHMMGFIADVAESMPEDFALEADDLPSTHGFMYFDTPISTTDRRGKEFLVRAVLWAGGTEGFGITEFTFLEEDPELLAEQRRSQSSGFPMFLPNLVPLHVDPIRFGHELESPEHFAKVNAHSEEFGTETYWSLYGALWIRRFVAAAFVVMHGKIGRPGRAAPSKRQQREAKRRKRNFDWGDIRVVELRRSLRKEGDADREKVGREVTWTHRWMVHGFWRWQWYPGAEGPCRHCGRTDGAHRRKYIEPYVKGPEHLPYIAKDVVYAVRR